MERELESMTTKSILDSLKIHPPSTGEIFEKIKGLVEELSSSNLKCEGDISWLNFEYLRHSLVQHDYDELDVFDSIQDEIVSLTVVSP